MFSKGVTCTLLAGISAISFVSGARAQDAQDEVNPAEVEATETEGSEILVTGSRIRGKAPVGSSLIGITSEQIALSTSINTNQLVQELPQAMNLGVSDSSRGQSGGAANTSYSNSINIRGLGPYSTLTLIDGHRSVPQGSTGFAVDPSVIPTLAVERIEIVADGASAIYGSDAVAGVANIILRRKVDGLRVLARKGWGDNYSEHQVGAIGGFNWGSGQITAAVEENYRSALNGRDRDFFRSDLRPQGGDYSVTLCNPGNIVLSGVSYAIPVGGVTAANRSALTPGTSNRCDPFKSADLLPEQKRRSAVMTFDQELTPWLYLKGDAFYSRREFYRLGNFTSGSLNVPRTNAFFVAPPGTNPNSETVQFSFEGVYPQLVTEGHSKARQGHLGVEVSLPAEWRFSVDATAGWNNEYTNIPIVPVASRLSAALASSNPATAFNPFGGATNPAVIADILSGVNSNFGKTKFRDYQAQIDGTLFTLPGGDVRMAAGYEHQYQRINPTNLSGSAASPLVRTKVRVRKVDSAFTELLVPIVGPANSSPGLRRLEFNVAGRYDRYNDSGDTWNPKIGVNWEPAAGLVVHGSYGTSFRAPAMTQLYGTGGGVLALFVQNYADPTCSCVRQGLTSTGESTDLKPETARTFSLGFDYRPPSIPGLNASVNFFDIKYKNQIQAYISDLSVLGRESQFAGTGVITRNPDPAFISQIIAQAETINGTVPSTVTLFVNGSALNTGRVEAQGLDFQLGYRFDLGNAGNLALGASGAYYTKYRQSYGPTSELINILNTIYNPPRFRSRGTLAYTNGRMDAGIAVTYVNSYENNLVTPVQRVKAYAPVDVRLGFDLGDVISLKGARISMDVRNLFDVDPPFVDVAQSNNGGGGFDPTAASPVGRVMSLVLDLRI